MRIILKILIPILLTTAFVYLPIIANQDLLLNRNNDLIEFFWPIINYIKQSILVYHEIPLWNNMFFMGTPLISDPQNLFWYLPNILFLLTSIDIGIITTYVLHSIFGGFGIYLAARELKFNQSSSIFAACLFIASAKIVGYMEAGHFGLVLSFAWFGWIIYSIKKLITKPNFFWSILLSISLSSIYFNHILTAFITILAAGIFGLILFLEKPRKISFIYGVVSIILFLTIISPALITQQQWFPQTTRDLLLKYPDVYPKWNSKLEFIENIFILKDFSTEKTITLGLVSTLLSFTGFIKIKNTYKFIILITLGIIATISMNNASPIYEFLITQNWYILLRVSTRAWFIVVIITIFLAALGFEIISKERKRLGYLICLLTIIESLFLGYKIISKPIITVDRVPQPIYEFLSNDNDQFRVFCTTRCLSQKESSIYGIKLAEGYGTLQQKNYYEAAKQIGQYYTDKYSLSIPPFDVYLYQRLQPHSPTLTTYGIKYVVSPHLLTDKNLIPLNKFDNYTIYKNNLYTTLNYLYYSPNFIKIDNNDLKDILIVPEIYNQNWTGYSDDGDKLTITQSNEGTLLIQTNKSKVVNLRYTPYNYLIVN